MVLFMFVSTSFVGVSYQREEGVVDTTTSDFSVDNGFDSNQFLVNETPGIQWIRHFGSNYNFDDARKVRQTSDGGYILVGRTESFTSDGDFDAWLIKTDINGMEEWNRTYGDIGFLNWTDGFSVEQTMDGGFIFVGFNAKFQEDAHTWVVKTTADGTEQWRKTYNSSFRGHCLQPITDEGYIIVGVSPLMDAWVCRIDNNGNMIWEKTFYKTENSGGNSVQQTPDGGFIIVGRIYYHENDSTAGFLLKVDADGHEQWNKTHGWLASSDFNSVQLLPDGYIVGGAIKLDGSDYEAWLVRMNDAGVILWNRTFSILPDSGSGVFELDCTDDAGFVLTGSVHTTTVESGWVLKTDAEGNLEWQITSVESYDQIFYSVQETSDGSFIVAGISGDDGLSNAVLLKVGHVPHISIIKPINALYFFDKELHALRFPFIIGPITIEADAYDTEYSIDRVEFLVDDVLKNTDTTAPYSWRWAAPSFFIHTLTVTAYNAVGNCSSQTINVLKIF